MLLTPSTSYGSHLGIYCNEGETQEVAEQALHMCRNGDHSLVPRLDTTLDSWAVQFDVANLVRGNFLCSQYII